MTRTRRGAMAVVAGTALALLTNTFGYSSARLERDVAVEVVADDEALLELQPVEGDRSPLEDGGEYDSPHGVDVGNAFGSPVRVTVDSEGGRFVFERETDDSGDEASATEFDVETDDDLAFGLPAGDRARVTIEPADGGHDVTDTVVVVARTVDELADDADHTPTKGRLEREITLVGIEIGGDVELDIATDAGPPDDTPAAERQPTVVHRWRIGDVNTGGDGLESVRLDYSDVEPSRAIDLAGRSVSVTVSTDTDQYTTTVVPDQRDVLAFEVPSLSVDGETVVIDLEGTGQPSSPGGGNGNESGATVRLEGEAGADTSVAIWNNRLLGPGTGNGV